jgi:hypothetical protein
MDKSKIEEAFSDAINQEDFETAATLIRDLDLEHASDVIFRVDSKLSPAVHLFLEYLCHTENTVSNHVLATNYLWIGYNYVPGASSLAMWHLIFALKLDPKDKGLMRLLMTIHFTPDGFISNKVLAPYAKILLEDDPEDEDLLNIINNQ